MHACGCGWVGWCAEDCMCRVENFKVFSVGGVDMVQHYGWLVGVEVGIRMGSLDKILSNEVWEV